MIMATFNRLASRTSLALLALALSPSVLAGAASPGSITFAPVGAAVAASSVPTLGTAALIFLALLLAFVAWVSMKKGGPTALSSISLALALVLGSSAGGLHWLQSAEAGNAGFFSIGSPSVATFDVYAGVINTYTNNAGTEMEPTQIELGSCVQIIAAQDCQVGSSIAEGGACSIDCTGSVANASDVRLKEDIVMVARAENGLPIYEYRYLGDSAVYRGVMAQDVLEYSPAAVHIMSSGYLAVDYNMLGMKLQRVR